MLVSRFQTHFREWKLKIAAMMLWRRIQGSIYKSGTVGRNTFRITQSSEMMSLCLLPAMEMLAAVWRNMTFLLECMKMLSSWCWPEVFGTGKVSSPKIKAPQEPGRVKPISVNYHFTRQCNYKCGFCFHTAKTSFVLPIEEAKKGLAMLKDAGESVMAGEILASDVYIMQGADCGRLFCLYLPPNYFNSSLRRNISIVRSRFWAYHNQETLGHPQMSPQARKGIVWLAL